VLSPNLLCIVPPYFTGGAPPAGAAALLAYLKANGCHDFDFLDLRLMVPNDVAPTYNPVGLFGESFVIDVPDLPLVLRALDAWDRGQSFPLVGDIDEVFERYCIERGTNPSFLSGYLQSIDRFLKETFDRIPDLQFVGMSIWSSNYLTSLLAAAHLKRRKNPPFILAGGPQVTESAASAELGLMSGLFDAVALGEGEDTLLAVYDAVRRGELSQDISGTMRLPPGGGRAVATERKLLNLTSLPTPDFSRLPVPLYRDPSVGVRLPYQLSRGCTDECSFCSEWAFWRHFRPGSPEHAAEQVAELVARYGATDIAFTDSLLNGHIKRLRSFAEELLRRDLKVTWGGFMRAQMDRETADLLHRAGCRWAFIGIESMSDETLGAMNKRRTEADNIAALRVFLGAGISVRAGIIPGFPADNRHRFLHTLKVLSGLANEYAPKLALNVEPFIVSPGQPLYHRLDEMGLRGILWPEEVRELAPRYREVTDRILCAVEGANQGMERLGQWRAVQTLDLSGVRSEAYTTALAQEPVASTSVTFCTIDADWTLGLVKSPSARIVGVLVDAHERRELEAIAKRPGRSTDLFALPEFVAVWTRLQARHLVVDAQAKGVHRSLFGVPTAAIREVTLSPHALVRTITAKASEVPSALRIVNILNRTSVRLPIDLSPMFLRLAEGAVAPAALEEMVEALGYDAADVSATLAKLIKLGLVDVLDADMVAMPTVHAQLGRHAAADSAAAGPGPRKLPVLQ
jgi:radical SAM superfamily enzyme YgiQ (UPF0313 family)